MEGERALGVLLAVSPEELALLDRREQGYACHDVTAAIELKASDFELGEGDRVYVFSFPTEELGPIGEGAVGFGLDYERIVGRACAELDQSFGGTAFTRDYESLCSRYADWPRLVCSNQRCPDGYR